MKTTILILFFLCVSVVTASDATLETLTARSDGRNITVEWRCSKEIDVRLYEVERSTANQNDFKKVGTVNVAGVQTSYRFVDENAFLRGGSGTSTIQNATLYVYRLKIVGNDDKSTYTNPISVTHTVSSVRRTWGMIKEMFR